MKMNITFCVSSMPNQRMVSGISAATGMLRPNSASGAPAASITRQEPARIPSGTPTSDRQPEADEHARSVAAMLCTSARSLNSAGKLRMTSAGLGRITGEISRVSGAAPEVASHQSSTTSAEPPAPTSRARHAAAARVEAPAATGCDSARHLLGGAGASAG